MVEELKRHEEHEEHDAHNEKQAQQVQDATEVEVRTETAEISATRDKAESNITARVEVPEVLTQGPNTEVERESEAEKSPESIEEPAKVMRLGAMMRHLLAQVKEIDLDEPSRDRMRDIYEQSITELGSALSPDLHDELLRLSGPFSATTTPSEAELAVAKAQLVGWLEGLVQGIQATLMAQQLAAQQQLEAVRSGLPPGVSQPTQTPTNTAPVENNTPGRYL